MKLSKSVLIIGASGRTGNQIIQALSDTGKGVNITAFCRDPTKLDANVQSLCTQVVKGNARSEQDLQHALEVSRADIVVVSIGNGDNTGKTDIRTSSAKALTKVLSQPAFQHVQAVVISSIGAGESHIKVGMGIGKMIEFQLRHVLHDHNGQEEAFTKTMKGRTMIFRPTGLKEGKATGKVVMFGSNEKSQTIETDRKDLAEYVAKQMLEETNVSFGSTANITSVP